MAKKPVVAKKNTSEIALCYVALTYGLVLLLVLISEAVRDVGNVRMFTNWTNFMCSVWMILYAISFFCKGKKLENFIRNKNLLISLVSYATITFTIVVLVLFPIYSGELISGMNGSTFFTHFLTIVIMWIIYAQMRLTGKFNAKTNCWVLTFPFVWAGIVILIGILTNDQNFIPYNFLKPNWYIDAHGTLVGWLMFGSVIAGLAGTFYGLGFAFIALKKKTNLATGTNTTIW